MPLPLMLAAAALPSVIKGISGLAGIGKANRAAKRNVRPTYDIPKEVQQNLAIAENASKVGLPQQQYNQGIQNINRNQSAGLRAYSRSGKPGNVASLVRASNDATLGLDVADAQARMGNQRQAMGYRSQVGQQQLAKQDWDKMRNYGEKAATIAEQLGSSKQNAFGALNDLSQLGQYAMMGGQFGGQGSSNATGVSQPQFNPSQFLLGQGMPNPMTTQPMSGFPFSGFGGMSNQQKIMQQFKGYNPYKNY